MNDDILDMNIQIEGLISFLNMARFDFSDIRNLKNKDDEYSAWSDLFDLKEKLKEAVDLINKLKEYEYN